MKLNFKEGGRIKGFLDIQEMKFLNRLAQKTVGQFQEESVLVEIGSYCGKSTVSIASALKDAAKGILYAIDWHQGSSSMPGFGTQTYKSTFDEFMGNLAKFGVQNRVKVIKAKSKDSVNDVPGRLHFLWIDGAHGYEEVKEDFDHYSGKIVEGGYLLFHDACWTAWKDPFEVIRQYVLYNPDYRLYALAGNTMAFRKEKNTANRRLSRMLEKLCVFVSGSDRGFLKKVVSFICFRLTGLYMRFFHNWED